MREKTKKETVKKKRIKKTKDLRINRTIKKKEE